MNFYRLISLLMTTLLAVAEPILAAQWSPSLSTVIQDANKEGKLKLMWGEGTLGGTKGAAKFETMMNKMFGTNIKIGFTPGAAMPQMGSQIAAEYAAGQSAASDVYIGADSYLAPLVKHKLFHEVDWPKLLPGRITNEMVEGGRTSLNILAAKEMWGKEAALEYVRQLSKQVVGLIRCNEIERVASGEFLAFVMDCSGSQTFEAQAHGSPVEHVIPVDGAMLRHRMLTVPKNAEHPNAAKLFTTFMLTKEAQKQLWDSDFSDMYMFPESQMGQRVRRAEKQGAKFFVPTVDWVAANPEIDAISEEMVKIMTQK